jgi:hypothetical protein
MSETGFASFLASGGVVGFEVCDDTFREPVRLRRIVTHATNNNTSKPLLRSLLPMIEFFIW